MLWEKSCLSGGWNVSSFHEFNVGFCFQASVNLPKIILMRWRSDFAPKCHCLSRAIRWQVPNNVKTCVAYNAPTISQMDWFADAVNHATDYSPRCARRAGNHIRFQRKLACNQHVLPFIQFDSLVKFTMYLPDLLAPQHQSVNRYLHTKHILVD